MEYGLILALTALFTVLILVVFGGTLSDLLIAIGNAIDSATGADGVGPGGAPVPSAQW